MELRHGAAHPSLQNGDDLHRARRDRRGARSAPSSTASSRHGSASISRAAARARAHALTWDELRRVYEIGVDHCGGKIPVCANPPEQHTARATREQTLHAIAAGVDIVNVYGPAAWHSYRPTDDELVAYFDEVVTGISHPLAIAPNPVIGYTPSPSLVARICDRHHQITAVNLAGTTETYFFRLMDSLRPGVDVYVPLAGSMATLKLGATGLLGAEANIIPRTFRRYLDLYAEGDAAALARVYAEIQRFSEFTKKWHSASPRWLKMAMKVLELPGGEGQPARALPGSPGKRAAGVRRRAFPARRPRD